MQNDFLNFWSAGYNFWHGLDPYAVQSNYYPPTMILLFALFALMPLNTSFVIWGALSSLMLIHMLSKEMPLAKTFIWFAYFPSLYILITGQLDILFFWLASFVGQKGWPAALATAVITLKPQIAFVVLPWVLLYWLLHDRLNLVRFVGFIVGLWALPLFVRPSLYVRWYESTHAVTNNYVLNSPGLFSFAYFPLPVWLLALVAVGLILYGLTLGQYGSWTANLLAAPIGIWYNTVVLAGSVPWQWMVPVSWAAFGLAALAKAAYPFALIPAVAFIWVLRHREKVRAKSKPLFQRAEALT